MAILLIVFVNQVDDYFYHYIFFLSSALIIFAESIQGINIVADDIEQSVIFALGNLILQCNCT